ncbi:MAG: hypothetical protein RR531_13545 [Longicatena sp.]
MEKLKILKADLQIINTSNDDYLNFLLESSKGNMKRAGIQEEDTLEYSLANVHYAAYLFRKRGSNDTAIPEYLRIELRRLKMSQNLKKD